MADTTLRTLLGRSRLTADDELKQSLQNEVTAVVEALARPGIHQDFRSDVLKVVSAALDLARTVSSPIYNIDEILKNTSTINNSLGFLAMHIAQARPRTAGYGLVHQDSGKIMPQMFLEQAEATRYTNNMRDMGALPPSIAIIPVEIVSAFVRRPVEPVVTPPAPEPLATLPRVLQQQLPPTEGASITAPPAVEPPKPQT